MAEEAGSRVVLVGDPNGFDPIGAGDAFRLVREDLGAVALRPELEAAVIEAQERFQDLDDAGGIQLVENPEDQVVDRYVDAPPDERPLILTHRRASADEINARIRERRAAELGRAIEIGERPFAEGDRVVFTASDTAEKAVRTVDGPVREDRPGVRSGALGTIEAVGDEDLRVRLDDGRLVVFDAQEFNAIDHGYALTAFRANGSRAENVIVYAESTMDRAAALVALSSHERSLSIVGSSEDFESTDDLAKTFARERGKPLARDLRDERVQLPRPEHLSDHALRPVPAVRTSEHAEPVAALVAGADDAIEETRRAIEQLRAYDRAPALLDAIDQRRALLPHRGDLDRIRQEVVSGAASDRRVELESAFAAARRLDQEGREARAALDGGRDARVEAVFEASRWLGPDGFEQLPAADRALVRELWEITIRPIERATADFERAEREWRHERDGPPTPIEQVVKTLATKAALAVAPRPLKRAAAIAFTVADLYRDTPRALLRMVMPRPLRRIETAVRLVAKLIQLESRPEPVVEPKRQPARRRRPNRPAPATPSTISKTLCALATSKPWRVCWSRPPQS